MSGQVTTPSNAGFSTDYVGWNSLQAFPLQIRHDAAQHINFWTSGSQRMTILSSGVVGIGTATPNPAYYLDVNGEINIFDPTGGQNTGYRINGAAVLQQKNFGNLFVGSGAGWTNNNLQGGGGQNTFLGYQSGYLNVNGYFNTFTGHSSGYNNTGIENTFTGYRSGYKTTSGNANTFIGIYAGYTNTTGYKNTFLGAYTENGLNTSTGFLNTFVGYNAGRDLTTGYHNTFSGAHAGLSLSSAIENVFMGYEAGKNANNNFNVFIGAFAGHASTTGTENTYVGHGSGLGNNGNYNSYLGRYTGNNITGHYNTFIGYRAGFKSSATAFTNSAGIGANAVPMASDHMILGDNSVKVGIGLSGNATGPGNKLEINTGTANTSGLRFRMLTSGSATTTNPGPGLLALNSSGDVIYVPAAPGSTCGASVPNALTASWEIKLNNFNYVFTGQGTGSNKVGIGTTCTPGAKLDVVNNTENITGYFKGGEYAVIGEATGGYANSKGVRGFSQSGTLTNWGVHGEASTLLNGVTENYGVRGKAYNADNTNYGVYGEAGSTKGSYNIGVYGTLNTASLGYGGYFDDGGSTGNSAATFSGRVDCYGSMYVNNSPVLTSDAMFKENINDIDSALIIISQLQPRTYDFKTSQYPQMQFDSTQQYGLIAQEVEQVLPDLVKDITERRKDTSTPLTYKTLNYNAFIAILIKGMQEQNNRIDSLVNVIANLPGNIPNGNRVGSDVTVKDVELGGDVVVLEQNVPNPFADQTVINYFIPENTGFAQILFYDNLGRIIRTVDITEKGKGQLNVFASNLANGMYSYTLIVDGKAVETKKMVKN